MAALRLFIAVTLPEEALAACARETRRVEEALGPLSKAVRFPRGEGLHFTLKFLGPTPEEQVPALRAALEKAAATMAAFPLVLGGLEAFPSPAKPRVVYLATRHGGAEMKRLAVAVEQTIAPLGFPTDERGFTPHVTLARVKDFAKARALGEKLAALPAAEVARVEVRDVALMLSELGSGGSKYTALARAGLSAATG